VPHVRLQPAKTTGARARVVAAHVLHAGQRRVVFVVFVFGSGFFVFAIRRLLRTAARGVHVFGVKPRGPTSRPPAPVHGDAGAGSDSDAGAGRGPDKGGREPRRVDQCSSSLGVWPALGGSSVRVVAGGASAKVAREGRRAEVTARARVQRVGEHRDLRTAKAVKAVRGESGRAGFLGFLSGPCVSSLLESHASGLRRVGVTPRLRLSPSC